LWLLTICETASAVPTCTIATGATLSFGQVVALASTPDQTTNTGTSFWVECSADVTTTPSLYSSTSPRALVSGANSIPLALSTAFPGGPELPFASPGTSLSLLLDGSAQTVVVHARVQSIHIRALPSGTYTATLSLTLEY
jgi:spore coat protein U-like protein